MSERASSDTMIGSQTEISALGGMFTSLSFLGHLRPGSKNHENGALDGSSAVLSF